jgi:RHS repeat-associated protein
MTADKREEAIDYQGPAGVPLKFSRGYHSKLTLLAYNLSPAPYTPIGEGWFGAYFQKIQYMSSANSAFTGAFATRPDGSSLYFAESNSVFTVWGDFPDTLAWVYTSGNKSGLVYTTASGDQESYNLNGQLTSITLRGGEIITLTYNATNYLSTVSDPFGHTLTFTWNTSYEPQVSSITDPRGGTISYTYDTKDNLSTVTYQDGKSIQYKYTLTGTHQANLLTGVVDETGNQYATFGYTTDGNNYASSTQLAGGVNSYTMTYNFSSDTAAVVDPLGTSRTYTSAIVNGQRRYVGASSVCPGCGEYGSLSYDVDGNYTGWKDFDGNITHVTYNTPSNLEAQRTEAYGTSLARTISTQWSSSLPLPTQITEPNRITSYTYDSYGNTLTKTITDTTVTPNATRTWTYTYDSNGHVLTATDPRSDVTTYAYYSCTTGYQCGQLETITDAVGNVTTYNTYNAHGQPLSITDPNGVVTTLTYDARLRLTSREVSTETTSFAYYPTGLLETVTLPDSSYVTFTYDNAHRLTQIADGAGNSTQYTLDNMGNRTAQKTYDPSNTLHLSHTRAFNSLNQLYQDINAANNSNVTTTYAYDSNSNQTGIDAPLSRNTADAYDALNRLNQITDPASGHTYFGYDANDNLTSVKDPRSLTTSYTYNGFGDLTAQSSPDTGSSSNTYDAAGNVSVATDARGDTANYAYDGLNRVTQIVYQNSGGVADQTLVFGYDSGTNGKGRLTSAADANHSLSWTYDALGRVTGKGLTLGTVVKSVGYGYANGDLTALTTPSGQGVVYGYNSNHQVTSITVNGSTLLSGVTYEPFGGVDGWTWGDGTAVTRTFNGDGLVSQIVTAGVTLGYSFDYANRITAISDSSNSALTWSYGYDLLDALTSASTTAVSYGWTYDSNGNRLTQTGTYAVTFTVNSTNNQVTAASGAVVGTYGYDAAGNLQSDGTNTYAFNDRGRMKSTSGASTNYLYSALGQMIEKSGSSATTILMYDEAGHILGEYSSSGALLEETIWLGDIPVATLQPNGSGVSVYYVHTDHLNSPRKVAQPATHTLAWRWDSDPFGTAPPNQNPGGLGTFVYNLRFPGQYAQAETGLNQNTYRDYDPGIGKYVESDPIGLRGGINTYAYGADDPINSFDADGLDRRRIGDPDVTQICSYYSDACRKSGGKCNYPCKTAPFICQHPDMIPSLWVGVSSSQINCIRTCLIAEDKKAQQAISGNCPDGKCLSNDTINDYHKKCYTKCGVGAWRFPGVGPLGN